MVLISIGVGLPGDDAKSPLEACEKELLEVTRDYKDLLSSHLKCHGELFNRVELQLGPDNEGDFKTTNRLLHHAVTGNPTGRLFELLFNMGRYLLISSSRPGSKPANLQGVWNHEPHPPWSSDWHLDMNLQMNYWLAEPCNLSQCTLPLFDFVESLCPQGEKNARDIYGCRGVLFPIATGGEGTIYPGPWVAWTGAAAWLAQHFWSHYQFSLDEDFLRDRCYPFMKKVAAFYEDFLFMDDSGHYCLHFAPPWRHEGYFLRSCVRIRHQRDNNTSIGVFGK